jgi:hypothetical protein
MPILLEFLAVKIEWVARRTARSRMRLRCTHVVADKGESARKVVVTIKVQTGAAF